MAAIDYQRVILGDRIRNDAFAASLKKAVTTGCTVIDIGAGTGFLSFLAREYGAAECLLIEREEEFHNLSKEIAKRNGITGCTFILGHSKDIRRPPKGDIVISETLGNFATEENIMETLADAARFLRPGGTMIPQSIRQYVIPLISDRLWKEIGGTWDGVGYGIDWGPAQSRSLNNMYVKRIEENELLQTEGAAREWDRIDLQSTKPTSIRTATEEWVMESETKVFGFCVCFECTLLPGITISTSPSSPETHWQQIYLPVESPLTFRKGETLELSLTSDSRWKVKINVTWKVRKLDASGKTVETQEMDMQRG